MRAFKGLIMFLVILGCVGYAGSGFLFGFDKVNKIISFRTEEVREGGFLKLNIKEMRALIASDLKAAESGADDVIVNVLANEEELARKIAQRDSYAKEQSLLKQRLSRAVAWAEAHPGQVYVADDGKKYSFSEVEADTAKKNERYKSLQSFIAQLDQQIKQYQQFIFTAKNQINDYLAEVSKMKSTADMALTDLSLRKNLAKNFGALNGVRAINADSFSSVEQMLGYVQSKLRADDAVQYRQKQMGDVPGISWGASDTADSGVFEEAKSLITGGQKGTQTGEIEFPVESLPAL